MVIVSMSDCHYFNIDDVFQWLQSTWVIVIISANFAEIPFASQT